MEDDRENLGRAVLIESLTGEKSIHFNRSILTSVKALRSDRTEAIYIIAPKLLQEGMCAVSSILALLIIIIFLGRNICGQTFLLTMMKYLKSNYILLINT